MKKYFIVLIIAVIFFIVGVAVGRFVMPRQVQITVVDINKLVDIIERYNEAKHELEKIEFWNEKVTIPEPEPEKEKK